MTLDYEGHSEIILLFVTTLAHFDIVLGLPWLQYHNPSIEWTENIPKFCNDLCRKHSKNSSVIIHALSPSEIDDLEYFPDGPNKDIMAVSLEDIEEALKEKPRVNVEEKLSKINYEFLSVFSRDKADKLPPHRPSDQQIKIRPGTEPPWGPLYKMSREELEVLKKYLKENLKKRFIHIANHLAGLFSGSISQEARWRAWRFCIDYRALNYITYYGSTVCWA